MDLTKPPLHPPPATADLIPHLSQVDDYLAGIEAQLADDTKYRAPSEANRAWKLERVRRMRLYVEDAARAIHAGIKRRSANQAPTKPETPPSDATANAAKPKALF